MSDDTKQSVRYEGYGIKPDEWTREAAKKLALEAGITDLTEDHWKVVDYFRQYFQDWGAAPGLRRASRDLGIDMDTISRLFAPNPLANVMKVAGMSTKPRI